MKMHQFPLTHILFDQKTLFKLVQVFASEEGTCLLHSGTSYETSQHSFLFLFPYDYIKIYEDKQERHQINQSSIIVNESNPWKALENLGNDIGKGNQSFPEWVGFFSYEMGAFSDLDLIIPHRLSTIPLAYWQRCALTLIIDQSTGKSVVNRVEGNDFSDKSWNDWFNILSSEEGWENLLKNNSCEDKSSYVFTEISPSDTKESYINKIELAKELIKSGDVYQINLSQQWEFKGILNPFDVFMRLTILNPSPFGTYLFLKEFSIISSSPERFLKKKGEYLETRPIKGTAPRGKSCEEDQNYKKALLSSVKERAELTMITDLMRNDLSKISSIGSVEVPLLCGCEAYHNVFHLYSIVRSRIKLGLSPLQIIRACFPGGSITGCPKLRAMEVISELEKRPRSIYTGAIGYFSQNGDFDFNIAIRTLMVTDKLVNVQLGGGIVIDSNPELEYEETLHKGRSIFEIINYHPN